jgi:hypothetical protein
MPQSGPQPRSLQQCERFSEDFLMIPKTIATLLMLFAFATVSANLASAQGTGFKGNGLEAVAASMAAIPMGAASTDEGPTEEASVYTGSWTATGKMMNVMTRDGWRVRMVPIC